MHHRIVFLTKARTSTIRSSITETAHAEQRRPSQS